MTTILTFVDGNDAGARASCAAKAAARHLPLKRQSGVSSLTRAESRVHPRTRRGRRTKVSFVGRRPPWSATLCPTPPERSPYRKPSCRAAAPLVAAPATGGRVLHSGGRLCTRTSPDERTA